MRRYDYDKFAQSTSSFKEENSWLETVLAKNDEFDESRFGVIAETKLVEGHYTS